MENIAEELWNAPFALISHEMPPSGTDEEPTFNYANRVTSEPFLRDFILLSFMHLS